MTITYNKPIEQLRDERTQRFHEKRQRRVKTWKKQADIFGVPHCGGYRERQRRMRNMAKHGSPG